MRNVLKIENGCSSAEDFKKRVKTKQPGSIFFTISLDEGPDKGGFYLEFSGFPESSPDSDQVTAALCHMDCSEKVTAFTVRLTGKFNYSWIREISMTAKLDFLLDYSWMVEIYATAFLNIRESMSHIAICVRKGTYKDTPPELKPFQYWLSERGNVFMAIPECTLEEAEADGDLYMYEVGIPCTYVLELGYRFHKGHVIVDAYYDPVYGLDVPDGYDC